MRGGLHYGPFLLTTAAIAIVFSGVWWLNRRGARRLQGAIDALDELRDAV